MKKLILDGKEFTLGKETTVALSFQCNDITKPDSIQANYSNVFSLPDSVEVASKLEFSGEVNSLSTAPYRKMDARVFSNGVEVVPYGVGQLKSYQKGSKASVQVTSGNKNFFDSIAEKSIRDLDLSAYNHIWTPESVVDSISHTVVDGYVYDIIDRGIDGMSTILEGKQSPGSKWSYFFPSTYVKTVWDRLFLEAGFTYEWDAMPELFSKLLLTPSEKLGYGEKFIKERSSKASKFPYTSVHMAKDNLGGNEIKQYVPFDDVDSSNKVYDGAAGNFNTSMHRYVADKPMKAQVSTSVRFDIEVINGAAKITLFLQKNGVIQDRVDRRFNAGVLSQKFKDYDLAAVFDPVDLLAGDYLEIYVEAVKDSTVYSIKIDMNLNEHIYFQVDALSEFPPGGDIFLPDWLPSMSQKDFVKTWVQLFDLTFQTDPYSLHVRITPFSDLITNIAQARDWSAKLHRQIVEKEAMKYSFGSFARKNNLIWKPETNESVPEGLGNGQIIIENEHLEESKDIIKMPFSATASRRGIPFIPLFERIEGTDPVEYKDIKSNYRLLVRDTQYLAYDYYNEDGTTITVDDSIGRPISRFLPDLDFEGSIIPNHYTTLIALLDKTKFISAQLLLSETDIANLDFSYPVYIKGLEGNFFYVNMISQWQSPVIPCDVELVRL